MQMLLPIPILLLLDSCSIVSTLDEMPPAITYAPVYAAVKWDAPVELKPVKPTATAGKIYAYGTYAFQIDQYAGIHIIGNAKSAQAKKIAFLQIPFCTEMAIRNDYLYTNHNNDIVVFDLSNPASVEICSRKGIYSEPFEAVAPRAHIRQLADTGSIPVFATISLQKL